MTIRLDRGPRQFQAGARLTREGRPDGARPPSTLPRLLMANAERFGARVAIREKEYGIWHRYTWADYLERAGAVALGLARLGFRRGDRLAIVGGNRPQLYWTFLAAECLGGIPVPIDQDAAAGELQRMIAQAEASIVVAEDQEQVDKVLEVRAQLPALVHVIYTDPRGMRRYAAPGLRSVASVLEQGREEAARRPVAIQEAIHSGAPDDVALISFTSGTTGVPKGVMLSHRALIATGKGALQVVPVHAGDEMLAYLPIGWLGDTFFSVVIPLLTGAAINCPEDATTVRQDFREIGPTVAFAPPRIWESLLAQCRVRIEGADWVKRRLTQPFVAAAMRTTRRALANAAASPADRVLRALGEPLVFAPLRDQLGLRRIRVAIAGGAPIAPEVLQFFWGIGVNLTQLYGLTECSTLVAVQPDGEVKPESVGSPIPGVEIRIDEGGEILVASPGLFSGYYRDPGSTAEALRDGWLRTGDAGRIDPNGGSTRTVTWSSWIGSRTSPTLTMGRCSRRSASRIS
jgi:long-chain acyl-CoA synthetase